jgi:transcription initiation factor TFIIH subunit 3
MNGIFSARRLGIPIDSCVLGEEDSAFLQQAAHITDGSYHKLSGDASTLLQNLLLFSSADVSSRKILQVPKQRGIDFRASCFCHKQPLEAGYVCSVCLSVYCEERSRCQTCDAAFET